jgi:integrase
MASNSERRLPSGEIRYELRWRVNGKAREKSFKTRAARTAHRKRLDETYDPQRGRITFETYAEQWLKTRVVKGKPLAPMTQQGYLGLLKRVLNPTFGPMRLSEIDQEAVRIWYSSAQVSKGQGQAAKAYRLLKAILGTAYDDERITRNPCRIKGAGIERSTERPMLKTEIVLDLADAIHQRLRALVLLGGFGGLRTGELLGLERHDVDELHCTVEVKRQAQEVVTSRAGTKTARIVTPPKSDAGTRKVAIPRAVMAAVQEHLELYTASRTGLPRLRLSPWLGAAPSR